MSLSDRFPRFRRLAPLILILAAVVVYFEFVSPHGTEEHTLVFQFEDSPDQVTQIDTAWSELDSRESEVVGGASLYFKLGQAPRQVVTKIHAPRGTYWLDITVTRGSDRSALRQRVSLQGNAKIFIPATKP
ncbi:MAG TPA: hypothetical protein PLJ27_22420 [Polyangiaceae bacterium]|jgi:hypothetical protein|nr:MAG: hypothetical protein BWY17_02386 [Deltaproteobacteria bacterium ADurb.Bin207]HNS97114.1 hypothetical protein [Polyangiaceae bacterium]HNZ21125.1 hypothetical protein [Polyangiaceae bacterium]HOD24534.1 hypothetical protein [Polyangiaceae bacterium]HOE47895.1 hypothetical protein [Polyangiaceae bacterium]